jgi:hypothetical protein
MCVGRICTYYSVVGVPSRINGTSCGTSRSSTPRCRNPRGRAVAPSGAPAATKAASRIRTDLCLAGVWRRKGFRHPRLVERHKPVLERVCDLPRVYNMLSRHFYRNEHNFDDYSQAQVDPVSIRQPCHIPSQSLRTRGHVRPNPLVPLLWFTTHFDCGHPPWHKRTDGAWLRPAMLPWKV